MKTILKRFAIRSPLLLLVLAARAETGDALNTWHLRLNSSNTLYGVAYGNGTFVAVGERSTFYTSPDGGFWRAHPSGVIGGYRDVVFGSGLFVAGSFDGAVATSPDGITWTRRQVPGAEFIWSIIYVDGLFVAAGGYGRGFLFTSRDAITWTQRLAETNLDLRALAFGNGVFVSAGPYSLATSTNGIDWTTRIQTNFWPVSLAFGSGSFVGVGAATSYTSSNGEDWVAHSLAPLASGLFRVAYGGGFFVALDPYHRTLSSADGEHWISRLDGSDDRVGLTYAQGRFVTAGSRILQSEALVPGPPLILQPPEGVVLRAGSSFTNRVVAESATPLSYQWRLNDQDLPGATNAVFSITNGDVSQSGLYSVVVTNATGATTSGPVEVVIAAPPGITLQPLSQTAVQGGNATLSVSASGTLPLTFQWRSNGVTVASFILNQSNCFFTVTNVQSSANYTVVVGNMVGKPGVLSAVATLTMLDDHDHDGLPDEFETSSGLDPNDPSDGPSDADHDGQTNLQEYLAGTDPRNADSYLKIERITLSNIIQLEFLTAANKTYSVQVSDSLDSPEWKTLANIVARDSSRTEVIRDAGAPRQRFYRLVTPAQP